MTRRTKRDRAALMLRRFGAFGRLRERFGERRKGAVLELHPAQTDAIRAADGPVIVLAGPGTGKTTVLVERIRHLVRRENVPPQRICALSFTRASAREMQQRLLASEPGASGVFFSTFHGAFLHILRENGIRDRILEEREQVALLREAVRQLGRKDPGDVRLLDFLREGREDGLPQEKRELRERYGRLKAAAGGLDFTDVELRCEALLRADSRVLERLRRTWTHFLVDEFQDASPVQYRILKLLAAPGNRVFLVGDDDQSIYAFRGAAPALIRAASQDFDGAAVIALTKNFRSAEPVIRAAGRLIACDKGRFKKTQTGAGRKGPAVRLLAFADVREQAQAIARAAAQEEGWAVLARTAGSLAPVADALRGEGLSGQVRSSQRRAAEDTYAEDVLAYLRLARGTAGQRDLLRAANRPFRGILRETIVDISRPLFSICKANTSPIVDISQQNLLKDFLRQVTFMSALPPFAFLRFLRRSVGYDAYAAETEKRAGRDPTALCTRMDAWEEAAYAMRSLAELERFLRAQAEQFCGGARGALPRAFGGRNVHTLGSMTVSNGGQEKDDAASERGSALAGSAPDRAASDKDAAADSKPAGTERTAASEKGRPPVILSTIHGAKGLEFDRVWIPDLIEGRLPHGEALTPDQIAEERRLLYVAMTRAKTELILSYPRTAYGRERDPSRYLREIGLRAGS